MHDCIWRRCYIKVIGHFKPRHLVTLFSAHCISDHRISDQKMRTVMVRAIVRVRVRVMVRVRVRVRLGCGGQKCSGQKGRESDISTL